MITIELNAKASIQAGMDAIDREAERQGSAIKGINILRPQKRFFHKRQNAIPATVKVKML